MIKRIRAARHYQRADDPTLRLSRAAMRSVARGLQHAFNNLSDMVPVKEVADALRHGKHPQSLVNWHHYREVLRGPFTRLSRLRHDGGELGARKINGLFAAKGRKVRFRKSSIPVTSPLASDFGDPNDPETGRKLRAWVQANMIAKATGDQFNFDAFSPDIADEIRAEQDRLIQQLENDARDAIDTIISDGIAEGTTMEDVAANVRDMIGLTDTQAQAVLNYQGMLQDLDPGALQRQLRNADYDAALQDAIDSGVDLSDAAIENMVSDYIDNYLDYRAATIAQTESTRAANLGLHDAYSQAIERGALSEDSVTRQWQLADAPCPICESIADNNPDGVGVNESFDSDDGPIDDPPVHPNCECSVDYVTDLSMVPDDGEDEEDIGPGAFGPGGVDTPYMEEEDT